MELDPRRPARVRVLRLLATFALGWMLALAGVGQAAEPPAPEGLEFFENHIRPLLAKRCYSCHAVRTGFSEGGLTLDDRDGTLRGGERGPAVVPGDIDASLLLRAVRYQDPDLQMPPDMPLAAEDVAKLEQWIRLGAPDPRDQATPTTTGTNPSDPVAGRDHWAFRPLSQQPVPPTSQPDWCWTSVDSFVLQKLDEVGLPPAADASPDVLLRRLYIQLTGLPPTPEQAADFLADTAPDRESRLVDRLLSAPQFGERWGRHWLDLARYSDSNGLSENFLFREAWRYRNWVLDAVQQDLPYDEFLRNQLAGDLLPYDSVEQRDQQRIASGFLLLGPKILLGVENDAMRMDNCNELIDTVGKAVLGQTLGCARCHDHKFDPVPTADYYALAGIFASTEIMEARFMLNQNRVMERLVGLGTEGEALDAAYEAYWDARPDVQKQLDRAKKALEHLEKAEWSEYEAILAEHGEAIAPLAAEACEPLENRLAAQQALIDSLTRFVKETVAIPPRAMVPRDRDAPWDEAIRLAGQVDRPGVKVPRGFLQVLSQDLPPIPADRSGRLELANWLTDCEHGAGHLSARVLANRIWHHLLGRGLVRTTDNFGRTGEAPTHPELLDHLAQRLIDSKWSVKTVIREVVLSHTFALSSAHDAAGDSIDPENQWLWRAHRRRLDPETFRDAMLQAAGQLDLSRVDSSVDYLGDQATGVGANKNRRRTDSLSRSVYLPVIRNDLPEILQVFDFADPQQTTGQRPKTMVATQGLFVLNDPFMNSTSQALSQRLQRECGSGDAAAKSERLFELVIGRLPTEEQTQAILNFVFEVQADFAAEGFEDAELRAWTLACHSLFASSQFQILE